MVGSLAAMLRAREPRITSEPLIWEREEDENEQSNIWPRSHNSRQFDSNELDDIKQRINVVRDLVLNSHSKFELILPNVYKIIIDICEEAKLLREKKELQEVQELLTEVMNQIDAKLQNAELELRELNASLKKLAFNTLIDVEPQVLEEDKMDIINRWNAIVNKVNEVNKRNAQFLSSSSGQKVNPIKVEGKVESTPGARPSEFMENVVTAYDNVKEEQEIGNDYYKSFSNPKDAQKLEEKNKSLQRSKGVRLSLEEDEPTAVPNESRRNTFTIDENSIPNIPPISLPSSKSQSRSFRLNSDGISHSSQPTHGLSIGAQQPAAPPRKNRQSRRIGQSKRIILPDLSQIGSNTAGEEIQEKESTGVHDITSVPKNDLNGDPLFEGDFTSSIEEKGVYDAISIPPERMVEMRNRVSYEVPVSKNAPSSYEEYRNYLLDKKFYEYIGGASEEDDGECDYFYYRYQILSSRLPDDIDYLGKRIDVSFPDSFLEDYLDELNILISLFIFKEDYSAYDEPLRLYRNCLLALIYLIWINSGGQFKSNVSIPYGKMLQEFEKGRHSPLKDFFKNLVERKFDHSNINSIVQRFEKVEEIKGSELYISLFNTLVGNLLVILIKKNKKNKK